MNMMHTMASQEIAVISKMRFYGPELKRQIVAEYQAAGASVAGVALAHRINANIVHRWIVKQASPQSTVRPGFVSLTVQASAPAAASADAGKTDIRIELRRGATLVNIA